jgi:Holliday junction resolvasome RuvABC endonuclease subunit
VKSIRKAVLGNGNAKKDVVQDYILSEYKDLKFADFDQSDAFLLGLAYFKEKGVL